MKTTRFMKTQATIFTFNNNYTEFLLAGHKLVACKIHKGQTEYYISTDKISGAAKVNVREFLGENYNKSMWIPGVILMSYFVDQNVDECLEKSKWKPT